MPPGALLFKEIRLGPKEGVRLELVARMRLQLAVVQRLPLILDGRRHLDVAAVNLNGRDQWQDEQKHGQQLTKAPLALAGAAVDQVDRRRAKRGREQDDADGGTDRNGRHHQQADNLNRLVPALLAAVQVPGGEDKDDEVAGHDGNGADVRQRAVGAGGLAKVGGAVPDARHGQGAGPRALGDGLQDKDARDGRQGEVDKHEELAQPAQDPVAAVVVDEGEQGGVVRGHGEQREHPDEEEVVGHERVHLGEADGLDADALHDLRVAVAVEELAADGRVLAANLGKDDARGEDEGEDGGNHEGEEDLGLILA